MSIAIFIAVISAALLHAVWNTLVKQGKDKYLNMTAVVLGHTPLAILGLFFTPLPAPESWPYLLAGIGLHVGYQIFLLMSYRIGDLTQVYPIARGTAPLLVAVISVFFLGVHLQHTELLAVFIIACGIISLSFAKQSDGINNYQAVGLALMTGGFIAAYSLIDGIGARLAGTSLGFYGWLALGNAFVFLIFVLLTKPKSLLQIPSKGKFAFVIGGSASFIAYALVTWSFTHAPIALVTALREVSIVFVLFIGVFFLKERLDLTKLFSTMLTLLGAALLRFSK